MYSHEDFKREVNGSDSQDKDWRHPFSRDYGRIIHSASFRRQQGKTQVFPGRESDFFRNRLTHSLEVAQIAEGIAERLNHEYADKIGGGGISGRLCATAGLVHDIGHPPFGHNGERALDKAMLEFGGFEGNAQTLRILTRLEKKKKYQNPVNGDERAGYNLCHRTIAAVLKYDEEIPVRRSNPGLVKGYYYAERDIVHAFKSSVLRGKFLPDGISFRTIECSIMDLADDIAYSVYDLEDCLKVGFLTPAGILASDEELLSKVARRVSKSTKVLVELAEVLEVLVEVFSDIVGEPDAAQTDDKDSQLIQFIKAYRTSLNLGKDGYRRTTLSSQLVHEFITGADLNYDSSMPQLSTVYLPQELHMKVEVLKQYTFESAIHTAAVKMGEFRGFDLIEDIFQALIGDKGDLLMPPDVRGRFAAAEDDGSKARIVCDFIAGMTDRYAMEFWARLNSDGGESMFKPI
jgi:dGTPase